jgi:hypothetical protein
MELASTERDENVNDKQLRSPIFVISTLSMRMVPLVGSMMRKRARSIFEDILSSVCTAEKLLGSLMISRHLFSHKYRFFPSVSTLIFNDDHR